MTIDIVAYSNVMLMANVSAAMADMRIPVTNMACHDLKNGNTNLLIDCLIAGSDQLTNALTKLRKVPDVISVERKLR